MKNYAHRGGCYMASTDNSLQDLHISSYDTKAKFIVLLFIRNNS